MNVERARWADLLGDAPEMAAEGRRLLYRDGEGSALLATVRDGAPPRIHPINVAIFENGLAAPSEFMVRGRARRVEPGAIRSAVAAGWYFSIDDSYELHEFAVESAVLGARPSADSWPPVYTTWQAPAGQDR